MNEFPRRFALPQGELDLDRKVGQLFMPAAFINDTEEEVVRMEALIREHGIGSLCFFHSRASAATNFEGRKKIVHNKDSLKRLKELIARYQKASEIPLLIAMDAEWGLAMRIENTPQYPYAITLGALGEDGPIREVGYAMGRDCARAGIHWNLAPVVDINNNPENPVIGHRSFGDEGGRVLAKSRALIEGLSASGTLHAIKHFPGHGDTAVDSHLGLPVIDKSLEELLENELLPFQGHIDLGVDAVMVGHLSLPQLDPMAPSTTSPKIITDLLRTKMGFKGVIISDALNMYAVSKNHPQKGELEALGFAAGMDVFCFSENPREGIDRILETADPQRIEESFQRVWALKQKVFSKTEIPAPDPLPHEVLLHRLAQGSLTQCYGTPSRVEALKHHGFLNLALGKGRENPFSKTLEREYGAKALELGSIGRDLLEGSGDAKSMVLALFPPGAKAGNQFGLEGRTLEALRALVKNHSPLIYHFGNPYLLDLLELGPSSNVVLVYQDFEPFQQLALEHFRGTHTARGNLPVELKCIRP